MQIDLPDELVIRVRQRTASAQGVTEADVIREALDLLEWADEDNPSEEELARSLELIDRSMSDIAAGRVLSVTEARQRSLDQLRDLGA
jgi:hypothetical protein